MSNYVTSNLIPVTPELNTPAIRIDDKVFVMHQSGWADVRPTTAQAGDVLSGKIFITGGGIKTSGSIPTVSATLAANVVTVPKGYVGKSQTLTVPEAGIITVSGNVATVPAGYISSSLTVTVGTAKAAQTYTPGTTNQTIASGHYLTGDQTIKGDANLLSENIVSGVSIFGVAGTYQGSGGGSATDFYKCASVTSGGSAWTGNKAVLSGGKYSYESAVTSGLSYTTVTPVVGQTYTDGALVKAELYTGLPVADLVFYASLSEESGTADTGQSLTSEGNITYGGPVNGIPCANFAEGKLNIGSVFSQLQTGSSFTASLWVKNGTGNAFCLSPGMSGDTGAGLFVGVNALDNTVSVYSAGDYNITASNVSGLTGWTHIAVCGNSRIVIIYINGESKTAGNMWNINPDNRTPYLGRYDTLYGDYFTGYLAAVRYYSRELSASEIAALAAEFTPSAS